MKNPRRAYEKDGTEIVPMTVANLREHGCRNVEVGCPRCNRETSINVDALPAETPVPDIAIVMTKLVCAGCGARGDKLVVRPDWSGMRAPGMGR